MLCTQRWTWSVPVKQRGRQQGPFPRVADSGSHAVTGVDVFLVKMFSSGRKDEAA